jgi:hypothetical protein
VHAASVRTAASTEATNSEGVERGMRWGPGLGDGGLEAPARGTASRDGLVGVEEATRSSGGRPGR